jgi:hypothetical protein
VFLSEVLRDLWLGDTMDLKMDIWSGDTMDLKMAKLLAIKKVVQLEKMMENRWALWSDIYLENM